MNDHQDFRCFLYGREKEMVCLQSIIQSALLCNVHDTSNEQDGCVAAAAAAAAVSIQPRRCVRDSSVGSTTSTLKSEHTRTTAVSTEDNSSDSTCCESYCDTTNQQQQQQRQQQQNIGSSLHTAGWDSNDSRNCQLVLVCGPAGSGKRAFINGSILKVADYFNVTRSEHDRLTASESVTEATASPLPFLLVEGLFRNNNQCSTSSSVSVNETSSYSTSKDGRTLIAFDDTIREIYDSLQNDRRMLEIVRKELITSLDNPEDDIQILTEIFPFMKSWLLLSMNETETTTTASNTESAQTSDLELQQQQQRPVRKEVFPYIPSTLLRKHYIAQQTHSDCPLSVHFLRAVANCIPLVLLLEDLHLADATSIAVMEKLLEQSMLSNNHPSKMGLSIVATYDSETSNNDYSVHFTHFLNRCRGTGSCSRSNKPNDKIVSITEDDPADLMMAPETNPFTMNNGRTTNILHVRNICISDYTWDNVYEWVQECSGYIANCSMEQKRDITTLVWEHATGKPYYIRYLLLYLDQDEFILYGDIKTKYLPKNLSELCNTIVLRLDSSILELLKAAAAWAQYCENVISCNALEVSMNRPCADTIKVAQSLGLFEYKSAKRCVTFCQNEIRIAAYNLIPPLERPKYHVDIGRRLWRNAIANNDQLQRTDLASIYVLLLAIVQFQDHLDLLTDFDECLNLSKCSYEAGKDAAFYGDYNSSAKLFNFAILVLGSTVWQGDLYETSLVLHNAAAQAYCCIGDFVAFQRISDAIFDNVTSFNDTIPIHITLMYSQDIRHHLNDAFRVARVALKELGESINCNPSIFTIVLAFLKMQRLILRKTDEELMNLPVAENDTDVAVVLLLFYASLFSYVVKAEIGLLVGFRVLELAVDKGLSGPSVAAFSTYSFVLCATGRFADAYRIGQIALKLAERFPDWRPRVHQFVYGYVNHWRTPFRDSLLPLQRAGQAALLCGDVNVYTGTTTYYVLVALASGLPLVALERTARSYCQSMVLLDHINPLLFALPTWCLLKDLICSDELLDSSSDFTDAETTFKYAVKEGNSYVLGNLYSIRTMWYFLTGNYNEALLAAKKSYKYRQLSDYTLSLYEGLASIAVAWTMNTWKRRKYKNRGQLMAKRMKSWAAQNPANFLNKQLLLEAEMAALNGETTKALDLFQQSIDKSTDEGMIHEAGIAYERLGHYHHYLGNPLDSTKHYKNARAAYEKWEAVLLVRRMDDIIGLQMVPKLDKD